MGRHRFVVAALCVLGASPAGASPRLSVETTGHDTTWVPLDEAITKHEDLARFGTSDDDHAQRAKVHASYTMLARDHGDAADGSTLRIGAYGNQVLHGDWVSTVATDSTHRVGVALDGTAELTSWLALEGRVSCASTRFVGNAAGITATLAPRVISTAGVTAKRGESFVSLRARGFTERPDSEDGLLVADRIALVDVEAGMRRGPWDLTLTIENLLDTSFSEASVVAEGSGTPLTAKAFLSYAY